MLDCSKVAAARRSLIFQWIAVCSLATIAAISAWACNEDFPEELRPSPPPILVADGDAGDAAGAAIVPKGARTLGVEVEIDSLAFPDQVRALADAGARTTNATFTWDDVETPADAGPDADATTTQIFNAGIHIVNLVLGTSNVKASLGIAAIDESGPRFPFDLAGRGLDDAELTARFDKVTDYVFTQLPDLELDAYLVAVDVDATLRTDPARWAAFAAFVDHVAKHARTKQTGLRVGFVMSATALVEKKDLAAAALAASDVVVVSHPPSLGAVADAAPAGKPIYVHRTATPPGAAFGEWDRHVDRIPIVTFPSVSADLVREARARGF